ncbi:transposase [Microbulbifer sp. CnH-101-E]|uniref:transposase n=1 Tax=unclassified Microbulbifer TaxID=2619833 RepID=UPI0040390612
MKTKGTRRHFNPAFKKDVKTLISEQGDSISKVSEAAGTTANNLRRWIKGLKQEEGNCWDKVPTERFFSGLKRE